MYTYMLMIHAHDFLCSTRVDVLSLTETWLKSDMVMMSCSQCFLLDMQRSIIRVQRAVSEGWQSFTVPLSGSQASTWRTSNVSHSRFIAVAVHVNSLVFLLVTIYRPPVAVSEILAAKKAAERCNVANSRLLLV